MDESTEKNLKSAFAGESQARNRYQIYADAAEREGFPNVARLFRAVAYAEKIHAASHFKQLKDTGGSFTLGKTKENLQVAIDGETYEINTMYPSFIKTAEEKDESRAARSFAWALEAEKVHQKMYTKAKESIGAGKDIEPGPIYICEVCGYTAEGEAPDVCPICGAKRKAFKEFS